MKKYIPNILTISRIVMTPLIIILGMTNHIWSLIIVAIIIALTDFFDGMLARAWKVTSKWGGYLDAIADKVLAIGLLILLIVRNNAFFYLFILECLISSLNLYAFFVKGISTSLLVGKIKTWFIFISIILGFVNILFPSITLSINWLIYATCVMQILTIISYFIYHFKKAKSNDTFSDYIEFYEIIEPFISDKEFIRRKDFPHHIDESVYEHTFRVSYDCYRISKRFNLDYKNLTIAALLHDFYEKPWQNNKEAVPFLEKHAFTHAHNAVLNAKKFYGERINKTIEDIMETHMFPVNKKIPKSKEAWLLTLVDKADSIDFIMHPIRLYKIFKNEDLESQKEKKIKKIFAKIKRSQKKKNSK